MFLTSPEKSELDDALEEQEETNQIIMKQQNNILSKIKQVFLIQDIRFFLYVSKKHAKITS